MAVDNVWAVTIDCHGLYYLSDHVWLHNSSLDKDSLIK